MRSVLPLCVALLLGAPSVLADSYSVDTAAPSRKYLDTLTNLVYAYDAATNTLVPTGEVGATPLYVTVEVYPRGQVPSPTTGEVVPCQADVCISGLVAVVGPVSVRIEAEIVPTNLACQSDEVVSYPGTAAGVVTFARFTWSIDHCDPGRACGRVYLDGKAAALHCNLY